MARMPGTDLCQHLHFAAGLLPAYSRSWSSAQACSQRGLPHSMALYFSGNVPLLTFKPRRAAANASCLTYTQVLVLVPVFLIPAFLPRQSAYAKPEPQVRQTLEVWPANHYREEAPIVSNNNSHSTTYRGGFEGDTQHGFEDDLLKHRASAQHHTSTQLHSSPQQTSPQHASGFEGDMPQRHHTSPASQTQHAVSDSSTTRVAGAF